MKAVVFEDPGELMVVTDVDDPAPWPDEVVVKVVRCGVCASDIRTTDPERRRCPAGSILGHEFSGEIVEVGRDVEHLRVGDIIAAHAIVGCGHCRSCAAGEPMWCSDRIIRSGGYSQYTTVRQDACVTLASSVAIEDGALVEPVACGLHAVARTDVCGARVLVMGVGAIGLSTIYWAKQRGAKAIAAVGGTTRRRAAAGFAGADHFFRTSARVLDDVTGALDRPPEIVFECSGKPGVVAQAMRVVDARGAVVITGLCSGPDAVSHMTGVMKELQVLYSTAYTTQEFAVTADIFAKTPSPLDIDKRVVSFADFPTSFEALRDGSVACKLMLDPWRSAS